MAFFSFNNIRVTGVACAVPSNEIKTESYKPLFGDEEVEKFMEMTGVRASHRTSEHQTCSDLGYRAVKELLEKKGIDPKEIGALLFVSHSPDYRRPSTAFVLQYRLGLPKEAVCYDISLGCSSLVVGMQNAASIMNTGDIQKALVIVGDTAGKSVYPADRSSAMLFGEAGAVMLLEKSENENDVINNYSEILETLIKNYSLILLDCDFETNFGYFKEAQEIYLVQSFDVLTIQPLTAFLRDLKAKNILNPEKLRIILNKS